MSIRVPGPLAAWIGIPGIILAFYGSIATYELRDRAEVGQSFISSGIPVAAGDVTLQVQIGKGTPGLAQVDVKFVGSGGEQVATSLQSIDMDTPIPREVERQAPEQGSRYAAPLKVLYSAHDPQDAIAEIDARRLVDSRRQNQPWTVACIGAAALLLALAGARIVVTSSAARRAGNS